MTERTAIQQPNYNAEYVQHYPNAIKDKDVAHGIASEAASDLFRTGAAINRLAATSLREATKDGKTGEDLDDEIFVTLRPYWRGNNTTKFDLERYNSLEVTKKWPDQNKRIAWHEDQAKEYDEIADMREAKALAGTIEGREQQHSF